MSEAEPETECYRNILCGSGHNDGVFLCTLNFYLAAQGGGGGLNPLNPPPVDPPLGAGGGCPYDLAFFVCLSCSEVSHTLMTMITPPQIILPQFVPPPPPPLCDSFRTMIGLAQHRRISPPLIKPTGAAPGWGR